MIGLLDISGALLKQEGFQPTGEGAFNKREKRKNDEELSSTCQKVAKKLEKEVLFKQVVPLVRFHTLLGDNEAIELTHIPSSPSSSGTETPPTELDEPEEEILQEITKKREGIEKVAHVVSRAQGLLKKVKRYPTPVGKRTECATQWIDRFQEEKRSLSSLWWDLFKGQLPSNDFPINSGLSSVPVQQVAKGKIARTQQLIKESITELVDHLQREDSESRNELLMQADAIENFLRVFIRNYATESGLDLATYKKASQIKDDVEDIHSEADGTYTYRMISEGELNDLLNSIPSFLSDELMRIYLQEIGAKLTWYKAVREHSPSGFQPEGVINSLFN